MGSGFQLEGQWLGRRQVTDAPLSWLQVLGLIHSTSINALSEEEISQSVQLNLAGLITANLPKYGCFGTLFVIVNLAQQAGAITVSTLEAKIFEPLVEPCQLTTSVHQTVCATGPRWVTVWIDIEFNSIPGTAPRRSCSKGASISHFDRDFMVFRVNLFFHLFAPNRSEPFYGMARLGSRLVSVTRGPLHAVAEFSFAEPN